MTEELYFPCVKDWSSGEISKRVGPGMPWQEAVLFLKRNHSGSWQQAYACPQPVGHKFFTGQAGSPESK